MAFCLVILLGFAAVGFDLSYVRLGRLQMENATDAAAHAAMVVLRATGVPDTAQQAAVDIAHLNEVLGQPMKLNKSDVVFGAYNFTTKAFSAGTQPYNGVRVTSQRFSSDSGNGLINLTFGAALGYTEADVTQSVTGAFINRYFQVELDVTDSYLCNVDDSATAAVDLLNYLAPTSYSLGLGKGTPGDWIGLDVFTGEPQQVSAMKNVAYKYNEILNGVGLNDGWLQDTSTLSPSQAKGIGVCNKLDGNPTQCFTPPSTWTLPAAAGGYRQCPPNAKYAPPYAACTGTPPDQFAFPNHSWMPACDSAKPELTALGLWAGTDLAEAISVGTTRLMNAHQDGEPMVLILFTDGVPMACTGPGGGGLCGTNSGNPSGLNWQPCCADGLTCGASYADAAGVTWGGAGGDNNGASGTITAPATAIGSTACTEAQKMAKDAVANAIQAGKDGIDLFVIGLLSGNGAKFANELHQNRGNTVTFTNASQIAAAFTAIPSQVPLSIVH
jgi:Flp pilus assembly protein TadG